MFNNHTTKGLFLGKPEAEAESATNNLGVFFEDFLEIGSNIDNGAFIITGRKGAGKSAYAMWIKSQSSENNQLWSNIVKKNEFDIEAMIQSVPLNEVRYEAFFEWLILVKLIKLILDTKLGIYTQEYRALSEFMKKNSGYVEIDKYHISEIIQNKEVNFAPLNGRFGFFSKLFGFKCTKAPFYQMVSPLRDTIIQILSMEVYSNLRFYIMFDDLDVKFKLSNENNRQMLMDLIRIARRYNTEYLNKSKARILLFIRDDISDRLDGVDCDKTKIFTSYEYRINWYQHFSDSIDERNSLLRKFINKRIAYAFEQKKWQYNVQDPWVSFIAPSETDKSIFKYVLDYTFYLPRDLVSIFNKIGQKDFKIPLSITDLNILLKEYASVKKQEIMDELVVLYDYKTVNRIFSVLECISESWDLSYDKLLDILKENDLEQSVFYTLIDYSLIIPVDSDGHLYFNYREQAIFEKYDKYTFRLPKVLSLYFKEK